LHAICVSVCAAAPARRRCGIWGVRRTAAAESACAVQRLRTWIAGDAARPPAARL